MCKVSTFGGSCTEGFTCDGDAAQCAVARASNDSRCALKNLEPEKDDKTAGIGREAATGENPEDHPLKTKKDKDIGQFDKQNPFGSGCPPDYTIALGGKFGSLTVPLSGACTSFELMGRLLVALTSLACAVWIVKGT